MKRALAFAMALALVAPIGLIGCSDEASVERKVTVEGPDGSREVKQTETIQESGTPPGGSVLDDKTP